jgi:CcmD family protein
MESTINTVNYLIAGYVVIFGSIFGYIISLFVRWKNLKQEYEILSETEE